MQAELSGTDALRFDDEACKMIIPAEQIGRKWRRHEWTFLLPAEAPEKLRLVIKTFSHTAIEVKDVRLVRANWEQPINLGSQLLPGDQVYELIARYPGRDDSPNKIYVYRNRLCLARKFAVRRAAVLPDEETLIEALRWHPEDYDLTQEALVSQPVGEGAMVFESTANSPMNASPAFGNTVPANGVGALHVSSPCEEIAPD